MKKTAAFTLILISLLTLCIVLNEPFRVHGQTNVATTAVITATPNPLKFGQTVTITLQITPAPPSSNDSFNQVIFMDVRPDGIVSNYTESFEPGNSEYSFSFPNSASNGSYTFRLIFLGQTFDNGTINYLPSESQTTINVTPTSPPYTTDIIINAEGITSSFTAPIQQTGNIYTLTGDVYGSITVTKSNIVLDGNGHTLTSPSADTAGMTLNAVSNVTIEDFILTGDYLAESALFGLSLSESSNVTVVNNTISGFGSLLAMNAVDTQGIVVNGGSSNVIMGNNILNNIGGMEFDDTTLNLIVGNNITENSNAWGIFSEIGGIYFSDASNNTVYHNNFMVSLEGQAGDSGSVNVWDDGFPAGGNYWADYNKRYPNATEIDNSGIGNTSYVIDSQNKDRYPLIEPFNESYLLHYMQEIVPPKVSVLSPLNQMYRNSNVSLVFSVNKSVSWMGYSLDREQNVTITGNSTITNVTYGLHSITVYVNDTFGIVGASQPINFTVAKPEPFPTVTVAVVSGAVAAVAAAAGLLVYFIKRKGDRKP